MPEHTDSLYSVTKAIENLLKQPAHMATLEIADEKHITYGDQQKIPATPFLTVESGPKVRELTGIGGKGRTDNRFTVFILCYISAIRSVQLNREDADTFAEAVELILHSDVTLGGLVVHGYVTSIEPGYATRSGELMRVARITWQGLTKTLIT